MFVRFFYRLWLKDSFLFLLTSLFLLMIVLPLLPQTWFLIVIFELILNLIFIVSVFVSQETQHYKRSAIILVVLAITFGWLGSLTDSLENQTLHYLFDLPGLLLQVVFIGFMIYTILKIILSTTKVTLHMVNGALSIYLLIGLFFSRLYCILIMYSDAFVRNSVPLQYHSGITDTIALLYYSFITLTTLGYGDITPATPIACMLAALEAIAGQLYIAVIIARMVALYVMHSDASKTA